MSTSNQRVATRKTPAAEVARQPGRPKAPAKQAAEAIGSPRNTSPDIPGSDAEFGRLHDLVNSALEDMKARDVHEIDVRGRSDVADLLVVASGTSSRHVRSIAENVVTEGKKAGLLPLGVEGEREGDWVLVDMGDIVVHVMQPRSREFYGLERLWDVDDNSDSRVAS